MYTAFHYLLQYLTVLHQLFIVIKKGVIVGSYQTLNFLELYCMSYWSLVALTYLISGVIIDFFSLAVAIVTCHIPQRKEQQKFNTLFSDEEAFFLPIVSRVNLVESIKIINIFLIF